MLDNDIGGYCDALNGALRSIGWEEYQLVCFVNLDEVGIESDAVDRQIWRECQAEGLLLLTGNRNQADPNSLEQTLREENTETSLPVLTISDPQRLSEPEYRERCVYRVIEVVMSLGNYLGSARQFIP